MAVATRSDEEIRKDVADQLHWNSRVDVSVNDGWVTLRGTVDAYWKKLRAEELASTLTGVQGVSNELAVVPSGTYEDKLIADSIVAALERSVHLDAEFIEVRVNGGVVTLSGSVASLPAFREAQQTAEYTPGVIAVNNDLVIR